MIRKKECYNKRIMNKALRSILIFFILLVASPEVIAALRGALSINTISLRSRGGFSGQSPTHPSRKEMPSVSRGRGMPRFLFATEALSG